jgi:Flp pilus assembly protein TadG
MALLELAIVLPLALLLLCGILEYSWMFLKSQQVINSTRQGARVGARIDATATDIGAAIVATMTNAGLEDSGYSWSVSPEDPTTLAIGAMLTVAISVPYNNIDLGIPLVPTPTNLTSTVTMVREGEDGG